MTQIAGNVAVVTGAAAGLGRAIAQALVDRGAQVVIADIEVDPLQQTADEIGAIAVPADVSDHRQVQELADRTIDMCGHVEIVVNNAGVGPRGSIADMTIDDWRWLVDVNLLGVIHGVIAFMPHVRSNPRGGHFLNTGSMASFVSAAPLGGYSVTKFGVAALTEALDAELRADGSAARATLLAPGGTRTSIFTTVRNRPHEHSGLANYDEDEFRGMGFRIAEPEDVAAVALRAIENEDLYALPHPELYETLRPRFDAIADAFAKYPAGSV